MYERNPEREIFFYAKVVLSGKGGHSAVPYLTHNPIPAAFRLIQILNGKLLYEFSSFQNVALIPVSLNAGTRQNVIPDNAELLFRGEASNPEEKQKLYDVLKNTLDALEIIFHIKSKLDFEAVL